ncbi:MAG: alkaline phosphatase family protein [Deltaproteobacteria bacterium]|nr:alkaline phosphatase family protein [Deltaproteobacteria bacterium]
MIYRCLLIVVFLAHSLLGQPISLSYLKNKPKLILVLVIDQFRADYLTRFGDRFLPAKKGSEVGGFSYLMSAGAYFPYGQFELLQNMTGPGHATILTGAYPYQSGIALNRWFDVERGQSVYCVEDAGVDTTEVRKLNPHLGASPKNLTGSTFGDELKNAGFASRVVSIAIKDRAAILLGGYRADAVLWMEPKSFQWISSLFYFPGGKLPGWVKELNQSIEKEKGGVSSWNVGSRVSGLSLGDPLALLDQKTVKELGPKFPHSITMGTERSLASPYGLELTRKAAEKAIQSYGLGKGKATDLLAVSFSSHDYVGHLFGPNSQEAEEITIAEDKLLSQFFNYLGKEIPGGLKNVLIVLTSDHGIPPNPDWLKKERVPAGRIDEEKLRTDLNAYLSQKFIGKGDANWVARIDEFNFYLNPKAFTQKNMEKAVVEKEIKSYLLQKVEGIAHVITEAEYAAHLFPPGLLGAQVSKTYFRGRSGDVVAIPKPFYMSGSDDTVSHQTGYAYDRTIPILIAGRHIRSGVYGSGANVVDIAPTLSFLVGVLPPSLSEGRVLSEILTDQ